MRGICYGSASQCASVTSRCSIKTPKHHHSHKAVVYCMLRPQHPLPNGLAKSRRPPSFMEHDATWAIGRASIARSGSDCWRAATLSLTEGFTSSRLALCQARERVSRAQYLLFELGLLGVHNFVLLGIGVVCHIQLLTISALTGKFNRFFVYRCERSSSSTERACSWYAPLSINMSCPHCAQQQTHRPTATAAAIDRWDREMDWRTDAWPFHKPCSAYYAGLCRQFQKSWCDLSCGACCDQRRWTTLEAIHL